MKIKITSQDGLHQYDEGGNAITTWDAKKCAWIVNQEFEEAEIDWWGEDNDFPGGYTLKEYLESNPNWDKNPDISVTWFWNTKETCIEVFGRPHTFGEAWDYWDKKQYPYQASRSWGYLDYTPTEAIQQLGRYCSFNRRADRVVVTYNGKVIYDGKLV